MAELELSSFGRFPADIVSVADALANPVRLAIVAALDSRGPLRFTDLLGVADKAPGALAPHLKRLQFGAIVRKVLSSENEELVESYELTPFGRNLLDLVLQAFNPVATFESRRRVATAGAQTYAVGAFGKKSKRVIQDAASQAITLEG